MIVVVGAGPAGAQVAYDLARQGEDVILAEEHGVVGEPVACTGLVTRSIFDVLPRSDLDASLLNTVHAVDIISPGGRRVRIPVEEFVVDRAAFDRHLVRRAVGAGAKLLLNHRFVGIEGVGKGRMLLFRHRGKGVRIKADILIGADGPLSEVAKAAGIQGKPEFYIGQQATVEGAFDPRTFTAEFGKVAPGFFAWGVPESRSLSRIGLATMKDTTLFMQAFLKTVRGKVVATQAGPIPIYSRRQVCTKDVFLVGDAAGLVKATTGGGIVTGMLSGRILADCIIKKKDYEEALRPLRRELWLHLLIRRSLDRFDDDDYDKLVRMLASPRVRRILQDNPREYPSRFLVRLLFAQPGFVRFAPKVLAARTAH